MPYKNIEVRRAFQRAYYWRTRTRQLESRRKYRETHQSEIQKRAEDYKRSGKQYCAMLRRRYGLTAEAYQLLLKAQKGLCAICHRKPVGSRPLGVDHRHDDNVVRGLLCNTCNRAVAKVDADENWLQSLILYLRRSNNVIK